MNIVYVILHYMAGQDTVECIESILNATEGTNYNTSIVVVDNGSTNDSYDLLQEKFNNNDKVILLQSKENLGFAKGNNIGFRYAKHDLKADFIVMLNNDTILSQTDFNEVLVKKYNEKQYAVLGPDIVTADGYHQNPGNKQSWSLQELKKDRIKKRIRLMLTYVGLDSSLGNALAKNKTVYRIETLQEERENTILHGACMVFSKDYISRFDGLNDETFLYMEEDILKLYADNYGFLMLYSPELQIFHKEDGATNMVVKTENKKNRWKYKQLIRSSKIYSRLKKSMMNVKS